MKCVLQARRIAIVMVAFALSHTLRAQWNCSGSTCTTSGNVGIGTSNPTALLQASGSSAFSTQTPQFRISDSASAMNLNVGVGSDGTNKITWLQSTESGVSNLRNLSIQPYGGNIGIGTTLSSETLDVNGPAVIRGGNAGSGSISQSGLYFYDDGTTNYVSARNSDASRRNLVLDANLFQILTGGSEKFRLDPNGRMGIGTTNPQYPLSVNGTIQAKEVIVNTGWADYVFKPDYHPKSLEDVAAYIEEHHHLPDVPTDDEVRHNGIGLGEMQIKLLGKVEELTLQLIQELKKNRELQSRITELEATVRTALDLGISKESGATNSSRRFK